MGKKTVVEEALKSFGLGSLLDALKHSEAFKKRLEEVNKQIEENLKKGSGKRQPKVMYSFSVRTLSEAPGPQRVSPPRGRRASTYRERPPRQPARTEKLEPKSESFVDVFDERDCISVIVALPGLEKDELSVELEGETLLLSAGTFRQEVQLPCPVHGHPKVTFKNGIFDIKLRKKQSE